MSTVAWTSLLVERSALSQSSPLIQGWRRLPRTSPLVLWTRPGPIGSFGLGVTSGQRQLSVSSAVDFMMALSWEPPIVSMKWRIVLPPFPKLDGLLPLSDSHFR